MLDNRLVASTLLASASLFGLASPVLAQSSAPAGAEEQAAPSDIVVTGSRTIRNGDNSPTPVTVVSTEVLTNVRPTSLTESINVMPVFSGSRGQVSNPSATGGVGGGNGSAATLNLRNIGAQRNLVLMDGRRVPPVTFTNIVDADVIPQLLVKRVDVVTGGVSAVYGSDAVTGVVNFVTDKDFNGLKVQAQSGISNYGDGAQKEFGIAWGTAIGSRAHFEASYEFRDDAGVLRRSDRDWYTRPVIVGNGTTIPYVLAEQATLSAQPFGGRITCGTTCAINGQYFASNGVLSPFVNGTAYAGTTTQSGGAGGYFDNSLKASQRSHQAYARFDYELSEQVRFFASAGFNYKRNVFFGDDVNLSGITISKANAFFPAAYAAQIPGATFTIAKLLNQPERFKGEPTTQQTMLAAGFEGKAGSFDWNLAYTHGYSKLNTILYNNVNNQKLSAALDVVTNGSGQPVCYAATQAATASAYTDCAPLNLFGPTSASAAALDYVLDNSTYIARTKQDDVVVSIAGSPFANWAGPVNMALSGEWRRQSFESNSDATPSMFADCTNLRFNCVASGSRTFLFRQTFPASPKVSMNVWEAAVEANVPLIKDVPLIQSFDVNGAARYTKYNTVGEYWTWKLGADWHVTDDLRFRGTISRDIRAPTLNDLFAPTSVVIVTNQDLKTGASNQVPSVNQANPNLTAEIGKTWTLGAVYKPGYLPGFSLAVDYYNIRISNAIVTVQGFQPSIQNGCYLTNVSTYCDLIVRDSAGTVTSWLVRPINLAEISTYGVDVEANYQGRLFGRPLSLRGLAAWQPHIRYVQPSVPVIDQGGVAFGTTGLTSSPSWRLTAMASFMPLERFRVDMLYRWRNPMKLWGDPSVTFAPGQDTVGAYGQMGLNLTWMIDAPSMGKPEFFFNIQNLFDKDPPIANAPGTSTSPGGFGGFAIGDDPIGRYFTAGFRLKF